MNGAFLGFFGEDRKHECNLLVLGVGLFYSASENRDKKHRTQSQPQRIARGLRNDIHFHIMHAYKDSIGITTWHNALKRDLSIGLHR
jgi:hypothetical protein